MSPWLRHLPVLPIVVPLIAGAIMLLAAESRRTPKLLISVVAMLIQLGAAVTMVYLTTDSVPEIWPDGVGVYRVGGWPAPFGIVLVVDRLSAFMVTLDVVLALATLVYSFASWERRSVHYYSLVQFLLMGLNGAFLTGDLFNLFVFFEILLASSYALLVHGGGTQRVKMAMHFIVVNLTASFAFLIGVALLYSALGTLNMADIAASWPLVAAKDRGLAETGLAILSVAFLVKAGLWPLNFWLPGAYSAAAAPVAAVFSIATKVGFYAILRVSSLLDSPATPLGGAWLFYAAIATMMFGVIGILAARQLARAVSFVVILSSGTLLAAITIGGPSMIAPALFYLAGSVLATGAFFLITGMTDRMRFAPPATPHSASEQHATYAAFNVGEPPDPYTEGERGVAIPAALAFLGLTFICCTLLVTGLPPLSGFIAKLSLISALLDIGSASGPSARAWVLITALLLTGFGGLIALSRIGIRLFWSVTERHTPRLSIVEAAPVAFLLLACIALTIAAGPTLTFLDSAAETLRHPQIYIHAVLGTLDGEAP